MLAAGESTTLPRAVQSAIDARLKLFEDRIASLLYKQAVEMDMAMSILLQSLNMSEEVLRQERAKSIAAVKRTNGQLRLEQITADIPMQECSWIELTMASSVRRRSYWRPHDCSTTWAIYSGTTPRAPAANGVQIDRKRLAQLRQKRVTLGHKPDDHELEQQQGFSMKFH